MLQKKWRVQYERVKDLLRSPVDFDALFKQKDFEGKKLDIIDMGEVSFPTGEILVRDPLVWLKRTEKPYFVKVPTGTYRLETLVAEIEKGHYRYVASRVKFNTNAPVVYHQAMTGEELLEDVDDESIFGFHVDAGLATIVDVATRDVYCDFVDQWYKDNLDRNIYDDYFAQLFKQNALDNPLYQREEGDWINFRIPHSDLTVPMVQSGFGDGQYPVFFGYDAEEKVCEVVMEFIFAG